MSYIGTEPKDIRSFGRTQFDYTATQGQTAFTGADDDGKVLAFTTGQINVYVNGILMDDSDFTTTGTGTVTLASAANLNDVISIVSFESNIPDNDYVPASGGTFTGNVTVGGTLGVTGATTMTGDLTVNKNSGAILTIETDDTNQATLLFKEGGVSKYNVAHVGSSDTFQVWNYTTNTRALGIDNAGRVTTPSQPSFFVQKTNGNHTTNANIIYNNVVHNEGSHYSTSNGRFTAPVAGKYLFSATGICGGQTVGNQGSGDLRITVNGSTYVRGHFNMDDQWESVTSQAVISLNANDYVNIYFESGTGGTYMYGSGQYSVFSGHLLG